ncbi:MAG: biotin/lipoyl-binding protein [Calditrichaeota bacterium]|nr:MAG: biotin/lipoyl-binding protein [Calditrichota bacterium]
MLTVSLQHDGELFEVSVTSDDDQQISININGQPCPATLQVVDEHTALVQWGERQIPAYYAVEDEKIYIWLQGKALTFRRVPRDQNRHHPGVGHSVDHGREITAPMPGKILKIFVSEGQQVQQGERLFIVEAMKMENEIKAPRAGTIGKIFFAENDLVSVGEPVMEFEE